MQLHSRKRNFLLPAGVIIVCLFLNMGLVRKKKTAAQLAQTDPIAYQKKMEEIKDGIKAAPQPSYEVYKKSDFYVEAPMEEGEFDGVDEEGAVTLYGAGERESYLEIESEDEESWWDEELIEDAPAEDDSSFKSDSYENW